MFYVILVSTSALLLLLFSTSIQSWYVVHLRERSDLFVEVWALKWYQFYIGFVRQVNILWISDAVPTYLTLTLTPQVEFLIFYVILFSTSALLPLRFPTSVQSWYLVRKIVFCVKLFSREFIVNSFFAIFSEIRWKSLGNFNQTVRH